jgi:hypothetical protein
MSVPKQTEQAKADRERHDAADGNAQLTEIFRNLERNNEQSERKAKDYVAENFKTR